MQRVFYLFECQSISVNLFLLMFLSSIVSSIVPRTMTSFQSRNKIMTLHHVLLLSAVNGSQMTQASTLIPPLEFSSLLLIDTYSSEVSILSMSEGIQWSEESLMFSIDDSFWMTLRAPVNCFSTEDTRADKCRLGKVTGLHGEKYRAV